MGEKVETKVVGRSFVIALGTVFIVILAGVVGVFSYYIVVKNNTIASLNTQNSELNVNVTDLHKQLASYNSSINSLTVNITNLQEELNTILNWSSSIEDMVLSDPSDWVNRTVIVDGNLSGMFVPVLEHLPYNYDLISSNQTIGVSLNPNMVTNSSFWYQVIEFSAPARIYGVVEKGEITTTSNSHPPQVTYYIEAETVEPL